MTNTGRGLHVYLLLAAGAVVNFYWMIQGTADPSTGRSFDFTLPNKPDVDRLQDEIHILKCQLQGEGNAGRPCPSTIITGEDTRQVSSSPPEAQHLRAAWNSLAQQEDSLVPIILANFKKRKRKAKVSDPIVLATHTSTGKLQNLLVQLKHWNGPSSIAFYVASKDELEAVIDFVNNESKSLAEATLHIYMEYRPRQKSVPQYPHNMLRNMALDHSGSDYFVALDVDFVPSKNCYQELTELLTSNNSLRHELENFRLMVLPAFEVFAMEGKTTATTDQLPSSKEKLSKLVKKNRAEPFHLTRFKPGHAPTNFAKWFEYNTTEGGSYYTVHYKDKFEPYVLGYRPGIPRYWGRFRGYGKDKMSWFEELDRADYGFGVLVNQYVVHLQHPSSKDMKQYEKNVEVHDAFLDYLDRRYDD